MLANFVRETYLEIWSFLPTGAFNPPLISFWEKVFVKRFSVEVRLSSSITSHGFFSSWNFCLRNSLPFHSGQIPPFHTRNKSSYWEIRHNTLESNFRNQSPATLFRHDGGFFQTLDTLDKKGKQLVKWGQQFASF